MDTLTGITLIAGSVIVLVLAVCAVQIFLERRNAEVVFIVGALVISGTAATAVAIIRPGAVITPLLFEIGSAAILGLSLAGLVRLVNLWRRRS